jgi:hypothetical protein
MKRDTVEISDAARHESMRDSETPLVVLGQGDSQREVMPKDLDSVWLDVILVAGIIGGLATIYILLHI